MTNVKPLQRIFVTLCLFSASELSHARHAAIVVDANTGNVIQQVDANQAWYPASLTKVMTLYMAFDALRNGQLHLDDMVTISGHAAHQKPSKLGLKAWDRISVEDAILAVITRSANDAAVVLAEAIGGSEDRFASKMTRQAHELNMSNSNFMNATGLPHDRQVTTAHDMALIAYHVQRDFPEYYRLFSTHSFYYDGREYRSTNKFVASYPGAEGMKTGYTCGSGHNLIATAQQNGKRLIGVVLGGMTSGERYDLMYDLMDTGFSQSSRYGQYGADTHIKTMTTGYAGSPPYQLDCGNKPESTYVYKSAPAKDWSTKTASVLASQTVVRKSHTLTTPVSRNSQEWSVDLGAFLTQTAAESTNRKASLQLAQTLNPARPVVVKHQMFNRESRWHALWTGFDSIYAAGDACKALWQRNVQCTVSRPESSITQRTASR
ncbi:D-alanyl-D-alanine carboxypeptidase DacF [Crenothrix polyspora]|uniref:D-alanyl-D-alanine carboxypeptidase DacF n=1 Tax=Crenothrix polyspora TaxID=360316 RepID=A0A1R4H6K9_9GAMM|nr:D-alanyl-D-alanine carboxypeptidase family protein [Crenothrix polyspora]SJM91893.1 D-alanyl-D-alanine carboxypeptidase DacF [Crenothrix polyspora]